jgi:hypothetical protein
LTARLRWYPQRFLKIHEVVSSDEELNISSLTAMLRWYPQRFLKIHDVASSEEEPTISSWFCYTVYNSPKFNGFINCSL